jgi:gamma-glutamyl-gamma-aminobutyrate hydrolase PuuD
LIANGADVNAVVGNYRTTALIGAAWNGSFEIVKLLIANGADVNAVGGNYRTTALMEAANNISFETVKLLIANGADVNAVDKYGTTALIGAAWNGSFEIVKLLIANGADVGRQGQAALYCAVFRNDLEASRILAYHESMDWRAMNLDLVESLLNKLAACRLGSEAWAPLLELVEARTGVSLAQIQGQNSQSPSQNSIWMLHDLNAQAAHEAIAGKTLIGIVTDANLTYNSISRVGNHLMKQNSDLLVVFVNDAIIDKLGIEVFDGLIFPGASDSYPNNKETFKWSDLKNPSTKERLYQRVYALAQKHDIPTLGICAGAQHLVLSKNGSLMKTKNNASKTELMPFTPLHFMSLSDEEQKQILESCALVKVKEMEIFRAHSYAAFARDLGEGLEMASIDGETPLAFSKGFENIGIQFHPEARYEQVSSYGDQTSNMRQTLLLNGFFKIAQERKAAIEKAKSDGLSSAEGSEIHWKRYREIAARLKECKAQHGL